VASAGDDGLVRLWEARAGGKELLRFGGGQKKFGSLTYCHGGRVLATYGADGLLRLWQPASGKEVLSLKPDAGVQTLAASPSGPEFAACDSDKIVIRDSQEGEELHRIADPTRAFSTLAYSPDGRMLAVAEDYSPIRLYETASWRLVGRLNLPIGGSKTLACLTFARGGKLLAAGSREGGEVLLWDISSGERLPELRGDSGAVLSVACSPDGTHLACGCANTTTLIWNLPEWPPPTTAGPKLPTRLSEQECLSLWADLKAEAPGQTFNALWPLVACPEQAVPYLGKQLRPVAAPDQKGIARDLADLGSDQFELRQQAVNRLKGWGDLAVPALRQRLADKPPVDERKTIEDLIRQANAWSPEQLQVLRAIQVLEYIGTKEAKGVLERLAGGAPESRLTQEAKGSLQRLSNIPPKTTNGDDR
jgi:WD domain, G-beta repeat